MKIKLSLRRPGGDEVDLVVTCDARVTIGELAGRLAASDPAVTGRTPAPADVTLSLPDRGNRHLREDLAVAEAGLRSGQTVAIVPAGRGGEVGVTSAAAVLSVVAGPDMGQDFPLASGANTVGRGHDAQVRLSDPMVSRSHVRINVGDAAELVDLGSANGTMVSGEQTARKTLRPDDIVEIGDSRFTVRLLQSSATQGRTESIAVGFICSPRLTKIYAGHEFTVPDVPVQERQQRFSVAGLLVPIAMALLMWQFTHQLMSLVFMAFSPLMLVGMWAESAIGSRTTYRRQVKDWRAAMDQLVEDTRAEAVVEVAARLEENPSTRDGLEAGRRRTNLLWTRRPDSPGFAELRCGLGRQPSRISFKLPEMRQCHPTLVHELQARLAALAEVDDVPVVARLRAQGGLGVVGPRSAAVAVARSLVAQAVALHTPNDLQVCVLASARSSPDWDWCKWLPHTSTTSILDSRPLAESPNAVGEVLGELEELIAARSVEREHPKEDDPPPLPVVLVVVEADTPAEFGRLVDLVETGWRHGVYVVWVAPNLTDLPASCRVFLDVRTMQDGGVGYLRTGDLVTPVRLETLDLGEAHEWARTMSPITDLASRASDATDIPRFSSFVAIVGSEALRNPHAIIERWLEDNSLVTGPLAPPSLPRKAGTLRATIGHTASGLQTIDLRSQGPHALVGGTTGAGKSELLQTWILGMAANHSPARVNFLLVDYKGGSAFAEVADLPHTVGLVTDLGLAGVHRALASLGAELRYREHLLNATKAKDLAALEKSDPAIAPPSLVIVVDEFAALVTEVPEFIDGVIDVAARGRSLGLHLILATQRPAGVIKESLRANTNLRIALRVADVDDSTDVLGAPDAAYFDPDVPGRAMSKTGPGRMVGFQTAYVGGHTGEAEPPPEIEVVTLGFGRPETWEAPAVTSHAAHKEKEESDLKRITRVIQQAHEVAQLPAPRQPWLPDLASYYNIADRTRVPNRRTDAELVFAIGDDPDQQEQPPISFRPDVVGNMAVFGGGGSGKSTLLRTLAVVAGMTVHGGPCHVYGLDFSSRGLSMIEELPHVGSVVVGGDDERVQRLIRWLRDVIDERAGRYSAVNAATITEYRAIAGAPDEPRILLLVDGVLAFRAAYDSGSNYRVWDSFVSLAADGRPVGVHVVMTCDQPMLPTTLAASVQQRLVLRLASDDDYSTLGVPIGMLTADSPPGRCLADGLEAQVAILGGDPALEASKSAGGAAWAAPTDAQSQAVNLRAFATAMRRAGRGPMAPPVRRLPEVVPVESLAASPGHFPLGMESLDFSTVEVEAGGAFILAGPPGSGISSALRTIVRGLAGCPAVSEIHLWSDRPTSLATDPRVTRAAVGPNAVGEAVAELADRMNDPGFPPRIAVLIEGLGDFSGTDVEYSLGDLIKALLRDGHFVLASGEPAALQGSYSLMAPLKPQRRAMFLQFDSDGPELVSAAYPRARAIDFPVGRGVYAYRGRASIVQVALEGAPDIAP
ncbi:MAG: FtsK/SpoIIIE domain-containing protein [Actinomycetia bacterium]|nr:FtsK/SpoIIIE domain-containing protein [Actinomycetes bacterium]